MADSPLAALLAKVKRANERLHALDRQLARFSDRHPAKIGTKLDGQSGWHTISFKEAELPPERLALTVGEILYHGRSVLDHLVWALVKANGETPGEHNEFPIGVKPPSRQRGESKRDAFLRIMLKPPSKPKERPGKLVGVSVEAATLIESLQPYNRRNKKRNFLAVLNQMARDDRHHALHTSQVRMGDPESFSARLTTRPGVVILDRETLFKAGERLKPDTKLERFRLSRWRRDGEPQVRVETQVPAPIAFGDLPVSLDDLADINRHLADLLRLFAEFL
ncbi:MAG TPA: hypothetical protein VLJ80_10765 [Solirubrobacteraceae bacterium]|nr:hypothetical protein [Solirubrobacteraceae bacterium]